MKLIEINTLVTINSQHLTWAELGEIFVPIARQLQSDVEPWKRSCDAQDCAQAAHGELGYAHEKSMAFALAMQAYQAYQDARTAQWAELCHKALREMGYLEGLAEDLAAWLSNLSPAYYLAWLPSGTALAWKFSPDVMGENCGRTSMSLSEFKEQTLSDSAFGVADYVAGPDYLAVRIAPETIIIYTR